MVHSKSPKEPSPEPDTGSSEEELVSALQHLGLAPGQPKRAARRSGPRRPPPSERWYVVQRAPRGRDELLGAYRGTWAEVAERLGLPPTGIAGWGGYLRGFDALGPALVFWHEKHPTRDWPFR